MAERKHASQRCARSGRAVELETATGRLEAIGETPQPGAVSDVGAPVLAAKLAALAIVLVPFMLALFAAGAVASSVIARIEDAPVSRPSAWLLVRAIAAGWLILAVWAALGVLLGVLTRGTSAVGVGILYALVIEGLLSAFADSVAVLEPLTNVFLRARSLPAEHRIKRAGLLRRAVRGQPAGARRARRPHRRLRGPLRAAAATPRHRVTMAGDRSSPRPAAQDAR